MSVCEWMKSCWTIKYINYHHAETIWLFSPWDGKTVRIGLTSVVVLRASCIYSGVMSICHSLMNAFMFFFPPGTSKEEFWVAWTLGLSILTIALASYCIQPSALVSDLDFPCKPRGSNEPVDSFLIRYKLGAIKVSNLTECSTDWSRKCYESNWQFTYAAFQRWAFYQEKRGVTEGNTKLQEARL